MKTLIILTISALLLACGQKGALYLPQPSAQPTKAPSVQHIESAISDDPNDF
ncbi:MAG: lipoprotein [Moraxella sp.]|nr:lipoprotein [Moraxella sp.]